MSLLTAPGQLDRAAAGPSHAADAAGRLSGWAAPVDVSVCIAPRDGADMLRQCLTSLLRSPQGASLEVIVVDNGSADGSADLLARELPEVVLLCNAVNHGFAR